MNVWSVWVTSAFRATLTEMSRHVPDVRLAALEIVKSGKNGQKNRT
jgi:hypothetical protein